MKLETRHRILAATLCGMAGTAALALDEVLTPASYFDCQIAAQQATLVGMQEWASQRGRTDLSDAQKQAVAEMARERVTLAIYACGRQDAGMLGAYANRHADELATFLAANPQVKARLEAVGKRIAAQSGQMPTVAPSAKR